jgi:hypothetical protein
VDVVAIQPAPDPRNTTRTDIESKAHRVSLGDKRVEQQVLRNAGELERNREARQYGQRLENSGNALRRVGKVVRPIGAVLDAYELGSAFQTDGNRLGENTQRAASGVAGGALGGWGGAAIGAGIGSMIFSGPGTLIGGLVGGIGGAWGGDSAAREIYNRARRWY